MRLGMMMSYAGGFTEAVDELVDFESAGLDIVLVPEAYSFDAVSLLGFVAARTSRLQLASGIMQLYTRTPTLTAMTAAGLDYVSGGRFNLGLGASGPQVIEGFHGVPYDAPLARTREIVEICRKVWRARGRRARRPALPRAAAGRPGHRPRQGVEDHQPSGAGAHPDPARRGGRRRTWRWSPRSPKGGRRCSSTRTRHPRSSATR